MFWNRPSINTDEKKVEDILTRGVEDTIVRESIKAKLSSGKKLRIKFGIDPTSPDLHLGHSVALRKLRAFQEMGHTAVLIIGDFTAVVGDPTGKATTRAALSPEEVAKNMKEYISQAGLILDTKKAEIHHNSKWLSRLPFTELYRLAGLVSVTQMLERNDFKNRIQSGSTIRMHELFYPLMQAYDSVCVKADIELGGNDQLFNNLTGRTLMERLGLVPQDVLTVSLLEGTDGAHKMSKSLNNYIALREKPNEMFGKLMSIPDNMMIKYFTLCTGKTIDEINEIDKNLKEGSNPRDQKILLAKEIVSLYHGAKAAEKAEQNFISTFSKKEIPEDILEVETAQGMMLVDILLKNNLVSSKGEFARLILANAVKKVSGVGDIKIVAGNAPAEEGVYKIGKHRFIKIKIK